MSASLATYIPLLVRHEFLVTEGKLKTLSGFEFHDNHMIELTYSDFTSYIFLVGSIPHKPVLRPLSSMKVEEFKQFFPEASDHYAMEKIPELQNHFRLYVVISRYGNTNTIIDLCRDGFDVFFLINAGLAVQQTAHQ